MLAIGLVRKGAVDDRRLRIFNIFFKFFPPRCEFPYSNVPDTKTDTQKSELIFRYVEEYIDGFETKKTTNLMGFRVKHPQTGRVMEVFSDQPGFQFYSGNFLPTDGSLVGKADAVYKKHGGFCIETQNFPNAVNQVYKPLTKR